MNMDNIIRFTQKPISLPAEYRPMYQIAILALVLKYCCRGYTSSLQKLHLFSWCLSSKKNMAALKILIENNYETQIPHWTVDPVVNRALSLAIADGICEFSSNKKYKLTSIGMKLVNKIDMDCNLFGDEKIYLNHIGKSLTDDIIDKLIIKRI